MKSIIFNTEDVRATLDNRKTVTRRVVTDTNILNWWDYEVDGTPIAFIEQETGDFYPPTYPCRYQPGDILYVRETFCRLDCVDCMTNSEPFVHCTNLPDDRRGCFVYKASDYVEDVKWHSPVSMPKEATRIFLRVTDVRVEKLRPMGFDELEAEGINTTCGLFAATEKFADMWDSHIKPADRALYGWEANPYVWCVSFEKISKKEAQQHE